MCKKKVTAIVLAGGVGSRMKSTVSKQYMNLCGKPILYYSLLAFDQSVVDDIILVVGEGEQQFCKEKIVDAYGITKVRAVVVGGKERYLSVVEGLKAIDETDYVLIHDGARPFITKSMIAEVITHLHEHPALVVGVPSKDTVKIVGETGVVIDTPNRNQVYHIQTPQAFHFAVIRRAYELLLCREECFVTDDAMVVETMLGDDIYVVLGSYQNIKITTPEDMLVAESFMNNCGC